MLLFVAYLVWNEEAEDKLARRGLRVEDAYNVLDGHPRFFRQKARTERSGETLRERPERLRMVGPDGSGRLLTFILEYPDPQGASHVVTGWHADRDELARYRQAGGSTDG